MRSMAVVSMSAFLAACGTITILPGSGDNKRSYIGQQLVVTSARAAIRKIETEGLRGKNVLLNMSTINDQGGGNIHGGRLDIKGAINGHSVSLAPQITQNTFRVFDLKDSSSVGSSTSESRRTTTQSSSNSTGLSDTDSFSDTTSSGASTSSSSNDGSSTTNNSGSTNTSNTSSQFDGGAQSSTQETNSETDGTSETTTGTITTEVESNDQTESITSIDSDPYTDTSTSNTTNNIGASSSSTTSSGTASGSQTDTGLSSTLGGAGTTQSDSSSSVSSQRTDGSVRTSTSQDSNRMHIPDSPERSVTQQRGTGYRIEGGVGYEGMGSTVSESARVSDIDYLRSLIVAYLEQSGVNVILPVQLAANPQFSDSIDYSLNILVDVFGLNRSRTDTIVYNNERVESKITMEYFVSDWNSDELVSTPEVISYVASYNERHLFWIGPLRKPNNHKIILQEDEGLTAVIKEKRSKNKNFVSVGFADTGPVTLEKTQSVDLKAMKRAWKAEELALKEEQKRQIELAKIEAKQQREAAKLERKIAKERAKEERKLAKIEAKHERKMAKQQAKEDRKLAKSQRDDQKESDISDRDLEPKNDLEDLSAGNIPYSVVLELADL